MIFDLERLTRAQRIQVAVLVRVQESATKMYLNLLE